VLKYEEDLKKSKEDPINNKEPEPIERKKD
jgi:hypothetical protein